jgi:uncharacterized protein YodC (DUF2158 family)
MAAAAGASRAEETMADEFKPGDVVQLRSGGPAMTVDEIDADGEVVCLWFASEEVRSATLKPVVLVPYTEEATQA